MRRFSLLIVALVAGCVHSPPATMPVSTAPRAIAVYRAIAESIYVGSTGRIVAVAGTSLDNACMNLRCGDLASRWGVETLWWANGDSSEARDARDDLLSRAASPLDGRAIAVGQAMLMEADAGDVPSVDADVGEWFRFRSTHADAAGAVRMSSVGFRNGRSAIAFVDWRCGPTCGHTLGVALSAVNDSTWTIADMLLISSRRR